MFDNFIKWEDIIAIQDSLEVAALRIKQQLNTDDDFAQLKFEVTKKTIEKEGFNSVESDIIKVIIESMINCAEISDREDLPLVNRIIVSSTKIAINTKRAPGNFAIFSEKSFEEFSKGQFTDIYMKKYIVPYLKDGVLIGYKGKGKYDTGLVLVLIENQYKIVDVGYSSNYYIYIEGEKNGF